MSTMSLHTTTRPGTLQDRPGVPWLTVVPLAVVLAYADGFWLISLRGAVGAIERTGEPFASWLRESTLALPVFVLAVLGAVTLAARRFGPALRKPKTVAAAAVLVVAAGTLVGIAALVASSAYDYHLQSNQLQLMGSMPGMESMGSTAQQMQASLGLQVRAVGLGSAILLVTNLVLVGWVLAFRGGRLDLSTTRQGAARALSQPEPRGQGHDESAFTSGGAEWLRDHPPTVPAAGALAADNENSSRFDDLRLLLVAGLFGSAAIHAAVAPEHLTEWAAAGIFFIVLTAAELAAGALLLARVQPTLLLAATVVSIGPLLLWLCSRTLGLPFGPEAGVPEAVGLADLTACALEVGTLLLAVALLRARGWLRRLPPVSAHVRALFLVAVVAITFIGLTGSSLVWFDDFGGSGNRSVMTSAH